MIELIIFFLLLVVAIIDFKTMAIPSVLLTGMIFFTGFLFPQNLFFGVMGFILGYLLYESGFFDGVGDIKVTTAIAFTIASINVFMLYAVLICVFGISWKAMWNVMLKKKIKKLPDEFPFLPVFVFIYLALYLLEVLS